MARLTVLADCSCSRTPGTYLAAVHCSDTTSPITIENLPDRDFRTGSQQAANKQPTTSVLFFNVGIVEILSCNSLYVE